MNEHIRKCCDGAGLDSNWKPGFDSIYGQQLEKFAELIVKECANIANAGVDPAESHLPGDDILEHFGVE
jgi:hypothetical protein